MKFIILWEMSSAVTHSDEMSDELKERLGDFVQTYVVKGITYHVYKHGSLRYL